MLEFGTGWCGHCQAAEPLVMAALEKHPHVRHLRIEDGRGRRLGRSYGVKLWPTLVFLREGAECARLVRPEGQGAIDRALDRIDPAAGAADPAPDA
jgi:thioredoxin 1